VALVPFIPSNNDLEKLVIDLQEVQTIPLFTDLPITVNARLTSTSTWGTPRLRALNVRVLLDLENDRIIPSKYIPKDDDEGMLIHLYFDNIED
jgi:nitrogen fixation protein